MSVKGGGGGGGWPTGFIQQGGGVTMGRVCYQYKRKVLPHIFLMEPNLSCKSQNSFLNWVIISIRIEKN